jgi:hypothetical protein
MVFSEEKNRKTLANGRGLYPARPKPKYPKVFGFFFSRKKTFLLMRR